MSRETPIYFDGKDLSTLLWVTGVKRTILPERNITTTEVPGVDGSMVSGVSLAPITVTVTAYIRKDSVRDVTDARRLISEALATDTPRPLFLPDEPNRYLMAMYQGGAELSRNAHKPGVELPFYCADPVSYGEERELDVTGTRPVNVRGTYPCKPVITVKPPQGDTWRITKLSTNEFIEVKGPFTGEQTVVLDTANERCTVNGNDAPVEVESDYFTLLGTENVKVSGGTAHLEWVERWQ